MILATDLLCQKHNPGPGHPEQIARYQRVERALRESGLEARMRRVPARVPSEDDLRLVHEPGYLELAQREIEFGYDHLSTGDTQVSLESWAAAKAAVGCAIAATEAVMAGLSKTAFALVRPPGHHANAAAGRGFCVLNNVAVAARYAQRRLGV
ncbi:MAG: hypothetical protein RLZZ399_3026, partial [Verrucomicrobiota bacterium]